MQHDPKLRDAARVIYDVCFSSEEDGVMMFWEAEHRGTSKYRQAIEAAQRTRGVYGDPAQQLALFDRG